MNIEMKISKIYSNKKAMNPIIFNQGFNVIYGNVEDKVGEKNEHNLGKTSLVHLIDFLLLKKSSKKHFLTKFQKKFAGWVFYIELELGKDKFLTIKRSVDAPSFVSFKAHNTPNQDLSESQDWDYIDSRMYAKKETDSVTILENYLNFDVLQSYSPRHFLSYLLRTQYDYENIFKMRQFEGLDIDWKPHLFALLGYKDEDVVNKFRIQYEIKNCSALLKTILGNKKSNTGDTYNLKAAITEKEEERKKILEQIDKFDWYLKEKKLSKELVEETGTKIGRLNSDRYRLEHEIKKLRESLENQIVFDIEEVKEVFEQTNIFFPEALKKTYEDLISFNTSLSNERSKYLKKDLKDSVEYLEKVSDELKRLNKDKEEVLSFLRDTDTFSKYKSFQSDLIRIDEQITQFKLKLQSLGTAENYEKKIEELKFEAKDAAKKIKETIDNGNEIFDSIKSLFRDIFKKIMNHTALLVVKPNEEGNPEFEPTTLDDKNEDELTGQSDGYTATKVQCAAFVLAVLATYSNKNFFKFAYHDGLIESWGDSLKINFFKEIREITEEYDIQYIISVIKSDVPEGFKFKEGEVITTLSHDKTLFGFNF